MLVALRDDQSITIKLHGSAPNVTSSLLGPIAFAVFEAGNFFGLPQGPLAQSISFVLVPDAYDIN